MLLIILNNDVVVYLVRLSDVFNMDLIFEAINIKLACYFFARWYETQADFVITKIILAADGAGISRTNKDECK